MDLITKLDDERLETSGDMSSVKYANFLRDSLRAALEEVARREANSKRDWESSTRMELDMLQARSERDVALARAMVAEAIVQRTGEEQIVAFIRRSMFYDHPGDAETVAKKFSAFLKGEG